MRALTSASLVVSCLFVAPAAWAQDAGTMPSGCGAVTPEGECVGNTVRYCDDSVTPSEVVEYDCVVDVDPLAICQTISVDYGVDCALATGSECIYADENDDLFAVFCQGTGGGCVESAASSACVSGMACVDTDIGSCRQDLAVIDCNEGQGWFLDCATFNGTCAAGACVGVPLGGFCGDGVECAVNLTCDATGTCIQGGGGTDAGPGPGADAAPAGDVGTTTTDGSAAADAAAGNADAAAAGADATTSPAADGGIPRADATTSGGGGSSTRDDGCSCMSMQGRSLGRVSGLMLGLVGLLFWRRRSR